MIPKPHVDWFALAPVNSLLVAAAVALLCAVLVPRSWRKDVTAVVCALGYAAAFGFAVALFVRSADGHGVVADAFSRDRLTALATMIVAGTGLLVTGVAYRERAREDHAAEYYALLAAAGAGMAFFVGANNLMTLGALHAIRVGHEQIIADELNTGADTLVQIVPPRPVVLGKSIFE